MIQTPLSNRKLVALVGNRNAGKSTLFNMLIGFDKSIVSDEAGTTTDSVTRAMELIGYGPIALVDTAGIDDEGELGLKRVEKSKEIIEKSDLTIHLVKIEDILDTEKIDFASDIKEESLKNLIEKKTAEIKKLYDDKNKESIVCFSKADKVSNLSKFSKDILEGEDYLIISSKNKSSWMRLLTKKIAEKLKSTEDEKALLTDFIKKGDTVVLVVPIDSEAPKGRLILPQVQVLRECLDIGSVALVVKDEQLGELACQFQKVDLVITDSKIFKKVADVLPKDVRLTSFSILFARQKGDIEEFLKGAKKIDELEDGDKILIAEACIHTSSHQDIGTKLIPDLIKKKSKKNLVFHFSHGDFTGKNLCDYKLIIHCGGCMITRNDMMIRIEKAKEKNVAITNYGVLLSYLSGSFERASF